MATYDRYCNHYGDDANSGGSAAVVASGAGSCSTIGAVADLPFGSVAEGIALGDTIRIEGATGGRGGDVFLITHVDSGTDQVTLHPTPEADVTNADWVVGGPVLTLSRAFELMKGETVSATVFGERWNLRGAGGTFTSTVSAGSGTAQAPLEIVCGTPIGIVQDVENALLTPLDMIKTALADSPTFQAWCLADNATEALDYVVLDATDTDAQPLAELWAEDQASKTIAAGVTVQSGTVWARFEGLVPTTYQSEEAASSWITGLCAQIAGEVRANAEAAGLPIQSVDVSPSGAMRADSVERSGRGDIIQYAIKFAYGVS